MADLTFSGLQQKMQLEKEQKQGVKYPFRTAEDIYNKFKKLDSGWSVSFPEDDIVVINDKIYYKAIAVAKSESKGISQKAIGWAREEDVPVFHTQKGDVKQMQDPQWTGAVGSYARKYALQGLFAIGGEDVDEHPVDENQVDQPRKNQKQSQPAKKQAPKTKKDAKTDEANALFAKLKNRGVIDKTIMDYIAQYIAETGKPDVIDTKIEAMKDLDAKMDENIKKGESE